jgi:hypothetical protein
MIRPLGILPFEVAAVEAGTTSPAAPPTPPARRPFYRNLAIGAAVVVIVVILVPVAIPQLGYGVVTHTVCARGAVLASEYLWTPIALLNSPYRGEGWANVTSGDTIYGTNVTNGRSDGLFFLDLWNLTRAVNSSAPGPGLYHPCSQAYAASYYSTENSATPYINGTSNESDANEAQNISLKIFGTSLPVNNEVVPSVIFNNSYWSNNDGGIGTCGTSSPAFTLASSSSYPVTVPFTYGGRSVPVAITLESQVSYSYEFAAGGNYYFYDPSHASPPYGGGLAFDYADCTITHLP